MSGISPDSGGSSDTTLSDGHAAQAQPKGLTKLACRVPGCTLELRTGFLTRCRCCEFHSRQLSLELNGTLQRFCQQCGFFHPLEDFDDLRRSCRRSLERHRVCRRIRRQRAAEKLAAAAVLQPGSGDKVPRPQVGEEDGLLPTPHLDTEPLPATAASGSKKRRQQAAGGTGRKRAAPAAGSARQPAAASKKQKVQLKAEPLPVVVKVEAAATTTGNSGITVPQQPPQQRRQPPQQQQSLQRRQPLGSGPCQQQQQHSSESQVLLHTSVRLTPARLPAQTSFVTTLAQPPQLPASAMPAPLSAQPVGSPSQASVEGPRPMQPGSARAVIAATQQLMAAPPSASLAAAVPPSEWGGYLESIQPFVQHQLAVPPPPVLVEEALRILRAPTPSFMDIPSVSEMLDITADLGMLEELMQQHGPRHAPDLKSSSTTDSITPFNPAWPYLHLAPHVDLTAAARMH